MHAVRFFGSANAPIEGECSQHKTLVWPIAFIALAMLVWTLPAAAARCYVNQAASGANSGASWANAYTSLQTALGEVNCTEVWTAQGVYKPVVPANIGAVTLPERAISFSISPGVAVYGGFAGGEASLSARNPVTHLTVLSGDIDNNDDSNNADGNAITESHTEIAGSNSQHVVVMNGTGAVQISASTILDGFVLTGGNNSSVSGPTEAGGALWCRGNGAGKACSPALAKLLVSGNRALNGGGMAFIGVSGGASSPTLADITFRGNQASSQFGGAVYNYAEAGGVSSPTLTRVTFVGNSSVDKGGAMANNGTSSGVSSPTVTQVTFTGNSADQGGAVFNNRGSGSSLPTFTSVTFTENSADIGGAMFNSSVGSGLAFTVNLNNVILWGNSADTAPQIYDNEGVSSIFWGIVSGGCPNSCSNLVAGDPLLGALADNGGFTPTLMPGAGSAAINAVPCHVALANDQRGYPRPDPASAALENSCDIGAVEAGSFISEGLFKDGFESP